MGPEAALLLAGAGTGLEMMGNRRAEKDRRNILNGALERTAKNQDSAAQKVLAEGANYGQKRLEDVANQEQTAMAQSLKDIGAQDAAGAGASVIDTAGDAGAVSEDFIKAKADRAISEGNRLTSVARELAKVRAPGQQMNAEGLRRAELTGELGSAASSNRARTQAASLDAESVDAPWWGKAGALAKQVGMIAAMTAGAPGAAGASSQYSLPSTRLGDAASRIRFG